MSLKRTMTWIAVTDKLPRVGQSVIAIDKYNQFGEAYLNRNGWRWSSVPGVAIIVYWMAVPAFPSRSDLDRVAVAKEP